MPLSRSPDALVAFLLPNLPAMLVWLVGIAVALSTWRRHPRVSQTALVACVLLLVNAAGGPRPTDSPLSAGWDVRRPCALT